MNKNFSEPFGHYQPLISSCLQLEKGLKWLAKVLRITPMERGETEPFRDSYQPVRKRLPLPAVARIILECATGIDKDIKAMSRFDRRILTNRQRQLKWKLAAKCINTAFFYLAILGSLVIYVSYFVQCAITATKPYRKD